MDGSPFQAAFGTMPDISALLQFTFCQPIHCSEQDSFPSSQKKLEHWLGVAENTGDALTHWILADNNEVLAHSLVRPVADGEINKHVSVAVEPEDNCSLDFPSNHMVKTNPMKMTQWTFQL